MTVTADTQVIPSSRPIAVTPVRQATAQGMLRLAGQVRKANPEMVVHQHLEDAADQVRIGNDEGALRHLRAAAWGLQPQSLHRHGIHDDKGHVAARQALEGVLRHHHLVRDIQDAEARNLATIARQAMEDAYGSPPLPHADPDAGYGPGALAARPTPRQPGGDQAMNAPARNNSGGADRAVADPDGPQPRGSKQFAYDWDDLAAVIELATVPVRPYQRTVQTRQGARVEQVRGHVEQLRAFAGRVSAAHGPAAAQHISNAATALGRGDYAAAHASLGQAQAQITGAGASATLQELQNLQDQVGGLKGAVDRSHIRGWIPQAKWLKGQQEWIARGKAARAARAAAERSAESPAGSGTDRDVPKVAAPGTSGRHAWAMNPEKMDALMAARDSAKADYDQAIAAHNAERSQQNLRAMLTAKRKYSAADDRYESTGKRELRKTQVDNAKRITAADKEGLPGLVHVGSNPDGSFTAVDGKGNEYQIGLKDGKVTVSRGGKTASAPAGSDPTHTARVLAKQLAGGEASPAGSKTARDVQDAIAGVREAVEQAKTKPDQYGVKNPYERESQDTGKALDALADEAAKVSPDVQQLGKATQAVDDGAAHFGSRLQYDPGVKAAMDKLKQAVVEHQTEVATRGMDMSARHWVATDISGNKSYHTINDPETLRSYAQQAALRGLKLEPAGGPFDASGVPKTGQKLLAHAAAHGWNTSVYASHGSGGYPIYDVNAIHPEKKLVSKQSFVDGKRSTYSAEPVTKSMDRISQNPRPQYAAREEPASVKPAKPAEVAKTAEAPRAASEAPKVNQTGWDALKVPGNRKVIVSKGPHNTPLIGKAVKHDTHLMVNGVHHIPAHEINSVTVPGKGREGILYEREPGKSVRIAGEEPSAAQPAGTADAPDQQITRSTDPGKTARGMTTGQLREAHYKLMSRREREGGHVDQAQQAVGAELYRRAYSGNQEAKRVVGTRQLDSGQEHVLARGVHNGVSYEHVIRHVPGTIGNTESYRLSYGGQEAQLTPRDKSVREAADAFRSEVDTRPARAAEAEQRQQAALKEAARAMLGRDRQMQQDNPLSYSEITGAYRAAHGREAPKSTLIRWAHSGSNAQDRASDWYKAGLAKKNASGVQASPATEPVKITQRDLTKIRNQTGLDMAPPDAYRLGAAKPDYAEALSHLAAGRNDEALAAMDRMVARARETARETKDRHLVPAAESMRDKVRDAVGPKAEPSKPAGPAHPQPGIAETAGKGAEPGGKPEWQQTMEAQAAKEKAAAEANARGMDRYLALGKAQRQHLQESAGITIPFAQEFGLGLGHSDYNKAEHHLLNGRYQEAAAALDRAITAERSHPGKMSKAQEGRLAKLAAFRDKVAQAGTNPKDTLPALAKVRGNNAGMTALDHNGVEHQVSFKDGTVSVSRDGRTVSAPAGEDPTRTARMLAQQLAEGKGSEVAKPEPAASSIPADRLEAAKHHADWMRIGNFEDSKDTQTGYKRSSIGRTADFGATVRERHATGAAWNSKAKEYGWTIHRQRTEREGPDARGSHWSSNLAEGTAPTMAAAKSEALKAMKQLRAEHIAKGGDVGYGDAPTGAEIRAAAKARKGRTVQAARTWDELAAVIDLSARTPMLESTPAPLGRPGGPGLYRLKGNKHSDYLEQVVKALIEKRGMPKSKAYAIAWGALRRWRSGKGHVHPEVRAAAGGALGQEAVAAAKAKAAHAHSVTWDDLAGVVELAAVRGGDGTTWDDVASVVDLAVVNVRTYQRTVITKNGPVVQTVTQHPQNYKQGMGMPAPAAAGRPAAQPQSKAPKPNPAQRAAQKQRLLANAAYDRRQAALLSVQLAAFNAALYNALYGSNTTQAQKGATTAAQAGATTKATAGTVTSPQSAATAAGATPAQVAQTQAQAAAAAKTMSVPQLRAVVASLQAQITWFNNQAAQATAQAAKL